MYTGNRRAHRPRPQDSDPDPNPPKRPRGPASSEHGSSNGRGKGSSRGPSSTSGSERGRSKGSCRGPSLTTESGSRRESPSTSTDDSSGSRPSVSKVRCIVRPRLQFHGCRQVLHSKCVAISFWSLTFIKFLWFLESV